MFSDGGETGTCSFGTSSCREDIARLKDGPWGSVGQVLLHRGSGLLILRNEGTKERGKKQRKLFNLHCLIKYYIYLLEV